MKFNNKLLFFIFLISCNVVFAQSIANYTVARSTSISYSSISSSGSSFSSWRSSGTYSQDDNRSNLTNIGFDFWYNGIRYTQFSVSTNGFIDFSSSAADGGSAGGAYSYDNVAFYGNGSGTWLALAPFYDDMTAQGGTGALGNSIKYLVSGTAPNRVLTVEWINMAVFGNTTPDLNFQVKLYETTGVIEFLYGTMTAGTAAYSYTSGINAATLSNTPTVAQLFCQQTANTATFSNVEQGALSIMPAANTRIRFSPPATAPSPSGVLAFSVVTSTGMTLTWTNWCTNEVGYVLYNSTDGTNYSFVTQTAANTASYGATSLLPSTLYYWRMYAVTDGAVSAAISGSQSTSAPGTKTSNGSSTSWNTATAWTPSGVPTAADNVIIANGHTILIDVNAVCNNLTVGQGTSGTLTIGNSAIARSIAVNSNITINSGATLATNASFAATHSLSFAGNMVNNGTLNLRAAATSLCNVAFTKNGNQTISGSGATTSFNLISLSMGISINNTLDITSSNFSAATNFLTLTTGTFKLSTTGTVAITPYTALATIGDNAGLTINSASATVTCSAGLNLYGNLFISNGILNIGDASDENLQSIGGDFQVSGGAVNIAGRYYSTDINTLASFTMTNGTITLPTVSSTSTTISPFHINSPGSTLNMSNGSIVIQREGGSGAEDLGLFLSGISFGSITGGTLQIGNASTPALQAMSINTTVNIGNLSVNNTNATALLKTNLTVVNNVTISSGTLNVNTYTLSLGGNWINNGTFSNGGTTISFIGSTAQTMSGSSTTAFANLTLNNISGVSLSSTSITISDALIVNNGTFAAAAGAITLLSTATKTARIAPVTGTGAFSGDFTIQRYIASRTSLTWANLSSPVASTTVQDWDNELFFIYPHTPPTKVSNVLVYNETTADYEGVSAATAITPGLGFEMYLTDDVALSTFSNTTLNTIGTPNYGTQNLSLSYTAANGIYAGENLIGNPFASAIDLSLITKTNAAATVDVYDKTTGNYVNLSGAAVIAPHQGFWAYATSTGASFSIPETAKTTSLTGTIRSQHHYMQLTISSADASHTYANTLKLTAALDANDGWDRKDHPFRKSPDPAAPFITAACELRPLTISTFNSEHAVYEMPLHTHVGLPGKYQLTVKEIEAIIETYPCVVLEDKALGKLVDVTTMKSYVFLASPYDSEDRFVLHFSKERSCKLLSHNSNAIMDNDIQILQTATGAKINFNLDHIASVSISIINILGQNLVEPQFSEVTSQILTMDLPENYHGIYIVKITSENKEQVQKFVTP